jgi:hypothetical protein
MAAFMILQTGPKGARRLVRAHVGLEDGYSKAVRSRTQDVKMHVIRITFKLSLARYEYYPAYRVVCIWDRNSLMAHNYLTVTAETCYNLAQE